MGQYHYLVNMDRKEVVHPHDLGAGLKMWEQVANSMTVGAALIALISAKPGNAPADLGVSPYVGAWAGGRPMEIGDYAENGDLPAWQWEIPEAEAYGHDDIQDITKAMAELIEVGCSVRYFGDGWRGQVKVTPSAVKRNEDGTVAFEIDPSYDRDALAYFDRAGVTAGVISRPPAGGWRSILDSEVDVGQRRVIANLDKREYLNPLVIGEPATTVGMMRGDWGTAAGLLTTLFHPERRGGGDFEGAFVGRWRGDRLVATSEYDSTEFPTTDEVIAGGWTEISLDLHQSLASER
jgi:hypothetical protein